MTESQARMDEYIEGRKLSQDAIIKEIQEEKDTEIERLKKEKQDLIEKFCKEGVQYCHICEDKSCGDNINKN